MNANIHHGLCTHVFMCVHCIIVDMTCVSNVPIDKTSKKIVMTHLSISLHNDNVNLQYRNDGGRS
jgi:hypothetical protein